MREISAGMKVLFGVAGVGVAVTVGFGFAQLADGPLSGVRSLTDRQISSAPPSPQLIGGDPFADDFSKHRKKVWKVSDGWRNGEWTVNDWRASQVKFDGALTLALDHNVTKLAKFSGGEVQSKRGYGHGYYQTRMRAAPGSGTVSGFFTYTGPPFGKPWDEIDVEILGAKPREVMFTYFRDGEKRSHKHPLAFDATKEMHTYGFDWQPDYIRWYVDDAMVHEEVGVDLPLPIIKQKIMVSLWGSRQLKDWVGPFDPAMLPVTMRVNCITYSHSYATRQPCN